MNMQDKEIRALARAICKAATPGKWTVHCNPETNHSYVVKNGCHCGICVISFWDKNGGNDADFISHAKSALPAALDYIERLEARIAALEKAIGKNCEHCIYGHYHTWTEDGEEYGQWQCKSEQKATCRKKATYRSIYIFDQARFSDKPTPCQEGENL